ncbi:MAG: beta-lactamase family protein [Alphaproteobacteria bacterium]|nr:beta-lactamase family protein [Alphaproteobacteria bacterium]
MIFNALFAATGAFAAEAGDFESRAQRAALAAPDYALGVAHARGAETPVTRTFGTVSRNSDRPVSADASWHIGSISKSFTASLIMRLAERELLALDAPIAQYLPDDRADMHEDWRSMTLRSLLSHTSGLQANAPTPTFLVRTRDNLHAIRRDVLGTVWGTAPTGAAGTYLYSNLGYVLAGFVAEEVTGRTWEALIRSEIADTLGLGSLGFGAPTEPDAPRGHRNFVVLKRPVSPDTKDSDNPPWLGPAGTIHLSLADLVRWGQAHLSACRGEMPGFLTAASCREMRTVIADDYGLGWVVSSAEDGTPLLWHNGSNSMWYAMLVLLPEHDLVLAVTTNVFDARRIDRLTGELRRELIDADQTPAPD